MPKINVLPKSVAELIAAGEVVERPSSAVKEMIENSIDAGADSITVEIKNGGVRYIRVTDNGCGIAREDVRTAFVSHGTSKIRTGEDLDAIFTLGFRGEALPSIAAVSKLSMLTKTDTCETGTLIEIEGGEEKVFDDAGCPVGTTIIIRDLFYNTPARMKFLKKDMTEGTYISDIVAKTAISHPSIRFSLIKDGKQTLSTPGNGEIKDAVFAVFGKDVSEALIPCEYEYKSIKIKGFISKPLNNRPNRNLQYCYVNGRFVRIPVAAAALDEAYKNRIMVGKFPMCFLFIDIPAGSIDVNVHPAKTEIRFSEDASVFEAIFYAARMALNKGDVKRPEVVLRDKKDITAKKLPESIQMKFAEDVNSDAQRKESFSGTVFCTTEKSFFVNEKPVEATSVEPKYTHTKSVNEPVGRENEIMDRNIRNVFTSPSPAVFRDTSGVFANMISKEEAESKNLHIKEADQKTDSVDNITVCVTEKNEVETGNEERSTFADNFDKDTCPEFTVVGEIFRTYILVETGTKMLIIDKHAAHERMIFNKLSSGGFSADSQVLLAPVSVTLSGREYSVVLENIDVFAEGGFLVEDFGGGTVLVRECPVALQKEDINSIISEMAGELLRGNMRPVPEKLTWLYHSAACRAAIKAGDEMRKEEIYSFVKSLITDDSIRYCPHGRPVMYELSKHEIEKQFGRV